MHTVKLYGFLAPRAESSNTAFGIIDYCMHYIKLLVRYSVCFKQADSKLARL
jgi:hypothetical protein